MPRVLSNRGQELTLLLTGVDFVKTLSTGLDLTDCTFAAQIRRFVDDGAPLAEFDVSVSGDPEDGVLELALSAEDAAALTFDKARWSLNVTDAGVVSELYRGDVYFSAGATR
jgi:hypothetical protein